MPLHPSRLRDDTLYERCLALFPTAHPFPRATQVRVIAVRRNQLIERPELIPDKLERVRALVRLGYGTPHYETEALTEKVIG